MHPINVLLVFLLFFISCNGFNYEKGNGDIIKDEKIITEFDELEIKGNFDIRLKKTEKPLLEITTDANLHEFIEVEIDGDVLELSSSKNLRSDFGIEIVIGYQDLNVIEIGGASTIINDGVLAGDRLTIDMSGAGALKMTIEMDRLKINISGAGSVELAGRAETQEVNMSGAGGLDAEDLISKNAEVHISGVGGAHVHVTEKLKASVSGVGGITYSGDPKEVEKDVSGLGSISKD